MQIYVGGPIYALRGELATAAREAALALLWATAAGFPLVWHECDGGTDVAWIGVSIRVGPGAATVSIPDHKIEE
eukprot:11196320-Lingulodinium_polyedra.AAC.1